MLMPENGMYYSAFKNNVNRCLYLIGLFVAALTNSCVKQLHRPH